MTWFSAINLLDWLNQSACCCAIIPAEHIIQLCGGVVSDNLTRCVRYTCGYSTPGPVTTWMVGYLWAADKPSWVCNQPPGQLSLLPSVGW